MFSRWRWLRSRFIAGDVLWSDILLTTFHFHEGIHRRSSVQQQSVPRGYVGNHGWKATAATNQPNPDEQVMGVDATLLGSGSPPTATSVRSLASPTRRVSFHSRLCLRQAYRFLARSGPPAWKRLIARPLTTHERTSMIKDIFSDRDEIEVVNRLCGDDARSFVDVIDEVPPTLSPWNKPTNFASHWLGVGYPDATPPE